jgi:CDP-Glycerol:Poly(glycerophosphate) glycerophosphotransferase
MTGKTIILSDSSHESTSTDSGQQIISGVGLGAYGTPDSNSLTYLINRLPMTEIDGKSVLEWLAFGGSSLWWLIRPRLWPKFEELIRFADQIENLLALLHPERLVVRGYEDRFSLIKQVCERKKVDVSRQISASPKGVRYSLKQLVKGKLSSWGSNSITVTNQKKRASLSEGSKIVESFNPHCVIYLAPQSYRTTIYDVENDQVRRGEHLVSKILEHVKASRQLLCIDVDPRRDGGTEILNERIHSNELTWISIDSLLSAELKQRCDPMIRQMKEKANIIYRNQRFRDCMVHNGIKLWEAVPPTIESTLDDAYLPNYITTIELAKQLLKRLQPVSILMPYETGPYALAFIIAATELGIKTVGLQHGIIRPKDPDYLTDGHRTEINSLGHPVPNRMLVFGEYYRDLLSMEFSYPPQSLLVVGHPGYDKLETLQKADQASIRRKLNLSANKATILVATSMYQKRYGSEDYDISMLENTIKSWRDSNNIQLIIKPHPREDASIIERMLVDKQAGQNFSLSTAPIQQLILACDIFLTVMTTAVLEAMAFEKPIVMFQPFTNHAIDVLGVIESGSALTAVPENLRQVVDTAIQSDKVRSELLTNGRNFIKQHFAMPPEGVNKKIADVLVNN